MAVSLDCGCDTRKETIGEDRFWNGLLIGGAAVTLLIARGGKVSRNTRNLLSIAMAGAVIAVVSNAIVKPNVKV